MTTFVFGAPAGKPAPVVLAAEIDVRGVRFKREGDRMTTVLESLLVVADRDTGKTYTQDRQIDLSLPTQVHAQVEKSWLPVFRNQELPPGTYQARLLVRDPRDGKIGTVSHEFDVDRPEGLRASTPILTDQVRSEPGGGSTPIPVVRRSFAPGATLHYMFDVYGAQGPVPRVSTSYEIRRDDGSIFAHTDPRPLSVGPQGQIAQRLALSLKNAAPGGYVLVLKVVDEVAQQAIEVQDPFTVDVSR
jgi:hypothetical protein